MRNDIEPKISQIYADDLTARVDELAILLMACVQDGAAMHFVLPFTEEDSAAFWREKVLPGVTNGTRIVLIAEFGARIVGSVQLDTDTPPNQPHRADIAKLMVDPSARRRGIARRLMIAAEQRARARQRTLITLDTRTGDAAERLYDSLGYNRVGVIPDYSEHPITRQLDAATVMYKSI